MNAAPNFQRDEEQQEAGRQAASLGDLNKDAAIPAKKHGQRPNKTAAMPKPPTPERPLHRSTSDSNKQKPLAPAAKSPDARARAFSMSYDGQTQAEYVRYLRDRESR